MTLLGVLGMGRAQARARMTETVRIGTLEETTPPGSLDVVKVLTVAYEGPARIKFTATGAGVRDAEAGGQLVAVQKPECHIPSGSVGVRTGMFGVVDSSLADPALAGFTFRIEGHPEMGQTTALRFPITASSEEYEASDG